MEAVYREVSAAQLGRTPTPDEIKAAAGLANLATDLSAASAMSVEAAMHVVCGWVKQLADIDPMTFRQLVLGPPPHRSIAEGEALEVTAAPATPHPGDYVLATKWGDGDPGDPWAVGYYDHEQDGRHHVVDGRGNQFRANGFRSVHRIRKDVGEWLVKSATALEAAPAGTVNLWTMLTPAAFDVDEQRMEP